MPAPLTSPATSRALRPLLGAAVACLLAASLPAPASAQANDCEKVQKLFTERMKLGSSLQAKQKSKKRMTPAEACSSFSAYTSNNAALIKEIEVNGTWCHVPDNLLPMIKDEQTKVSDVRAKACQAATLQRKMEKQAREQASRPQAEPWGGTGDVLGGPLKVPRGAL